MEADELLLLLLEELSESRDLGEPGEDLGEPGADLGEPGGEELTAEKPDGLKQGRGGNSGVEGAGDAGEAGPRPAVS